MVRIALVTCAAQTPFAYSLKAVAMTLLATDLSTVCPAVATTAIEQAKLQKQQMLALIALE